MIIGTAAVKSPASCTMPVRLRGQCDGRAGCEGWQVAVDGCQMKAMMSPTWQKFEDTVSSSIDNASGRWNAHGVNIDATVRSRASTVPVIAAAV